MYAVIKTGGKQYKVAAGDKIKIEQMPADVGTEITLDQVLAVGSGENIVVGARWSRGLRFRLRCSRRVVTTK